MLNKETLDRIQLVLDEYKSLVRAEEIAPVDYHSLKNSIINKELIDSIKQIESILIDAPDTFFEQFKAYCHQRALENKNSCLSLMAMPEGSTNRLFWTIAEILITPQNLGQMLEILNPLLTAILSYELRPLAASSSFFPKERRDALINAQPELVLKPVNTLEMAATISELSSIIMHEDLSFDLRDIQELSFTQHQSIFQLLQEQQPSLSAVIYNHNESLRSLRENLDTVAKRGVSPFNKLKFLVQQLRMGGTSITGAQLASPSAAMAFNQFINYYTKLPPPLAEQLGSVSTKTNDSSLNMVIDNLNNEGCVESAADLIEDILSNPTNQTILHSKPYFSVEQEKAITAVYGRHNPLIMGFDNQQLLLPLSKMQVFIEQIKIETEDEFLTSLISFPSLLYTELLRHAQINYSSLLKRIGYLLEEKVFNQEQLQALNNALLNNMGTIGGVTKLVLFALKFKQFDLLKQTLISIESPQWAILFKEQSRWLVLKYATKTLQGIKLLIEHLPTEWRSELFQKDSSTIYDLLLYNIDYTDSIAFILSLYSPNDCQYMISHKPSETFISLLHFSTQNPKVLKLFLELYPKTKRNELIFMKDGYGVNVAHYASSDPASLAVMEQLVDRDEFTQALKVIDNKGQTALHHAVSNVDSLDFLMRRDPENTRSDLVYLKDDGGCSPLHLSVDYIDSLVFIMALFPNETERRSILQLKNNNGQSLLHLSVGNFGSFRFILRHYCSEEFPSILNEPINDGRILLHLAENNLFSFRHILTLYNETELQSILYVKDNNGCNLLHFVAAEMELLSLILPLYTVSGWENLASLTNNKGETVFHLAALSANSLRWLLDCYREANYNKLIKLTTIDGNTLLHYAVNSKESLSFLINCLPRSLLKEGLLIRNTTDESVLDWAAEQVEVLAVIRSIFEYEEFVELIQSPNLVGYTLFYKLIDFPDSLAWLLKQVGEDPRIISSILEPKNNFELSLLHCAVQKNKMALELLLGFYSAEQRLVIFLQRNAFGYTVLDNAAMFPEILWMLLNSLTMEERLVAIKLTTSNGRSLLHHAVSPLKSSDRKLQFPYIDNALDSLIIILSSIRENERWAVLIQKDNLGESALSLAQPFFNRFKHLLPNIERSTHNSCSSFFSDNRKRERQPQTTQISEELRQVEKRLS